MPDGSEAINQLPPEILTKFFQHTINTAYDPWNMRPFVLITLNLCSICSHWRSLIIGNASFWSYIPLGNDTYAGDLTNLFLERSQGSQLIDLIAFARYTISYGGTWQAIEELKPHIHRIRSLSIVVASFPQLYYLLDVILTNRVPPSLVHLSLMAKPGNYYLHRLILALEPCEQNFIQLCNQLQTLQLNNVWADFNSYSFNRLQRLTLDISSGFLSTVSCILPAAHGLHLLEIRDITTWRARERTEPEPARGLKTLRLRHPNPFCRWELEEDSKSKNWDVIDFHLPHNLTAGPRSEVKRNLECLIPYMRVNSLKITFLTLRNDRPQVLERISSMLQVLPNLHTLTFDKLELNELILSLFIPPPESSETFPRLHTLRLLLSDVLHIDMFKTLILSHPIRRLDLWRSTLNWDDRINDRSYYPTGPSLFYNWLCDRVPDLHISKP